MHSVWCLLRDPHWTHWQQLQGSRQCTVCWRELIAIQSYACEWLRGMRGAFAALLLVCNKGTVLSPNVLTLIFQRKHVHKLPSLASCFC